jgi:hypothetical protein
MKGRMDRGRDVQRMVAGSMDAMPLRRPPPSSPPPPSPAPRDDDAPFALQRYLEATDLRPPPDLARRIGWRIAAEPTPSRPSRLRAVMAALGLRRDDLPSSPTAASGSGRLRMSGRVRYQALGIGLATVVLFGGGAAAGLAGVRIIESVLDTEPSKGSDSNSLTRGTVVFPTDPPVGAPRLPVGVGANDEAVLPDALESPLPGAAASQPPGRSQRGEDNRGGNGNARGDGVGGGRGSGQGPRGNRGEPKGPKGEPSGPKGEPSAPKGGQGSANSGQGSANSGQGSANSGQGSANAGQGSANGTPRDPQGEEDS